MKKKDSLEQAFLEKKAQETWIHSKEVINGARQAIKWAKKRDRDALLAKENIIKFKPSKQLPENTKFKFTGIKRYDS